MLKFILLAVLAVTLTECVNAKEVRYIRNITEGPYQNYSGRALVQLGDGWYFFETTFAANWYEAKNFCRTLGLFLVSVETEEENDLIKDHITNVAGIGHYWMSGNDVATRREWIWDSTGQKVIFTDWQTGQPSYNTVEPYMHYWNYNNELKWNNAANVNVDPGVGGNIYSICEQL